MHSNRKRLSRLSEVEARVAQLVGGDHAGIDIIPWVQSRLGLTLDQWQQDVLTSDAPRLLLVCPRQSGKSTTVGALAGAEMVSKPGSEVVILSPTQRQSGLLAAKVADVLRDENIVSESSTRLMLANGSILHSLPGDRPSGIRGLSATVLMIDEASRVRNELLVAAMPMTAATCGRTILLSTPSGTANRFHSFWADDDEWEKVSVTIADVSHYDPKMMKNMKRRLGERMWKQEFENAFLESPGSLFSGAAIDAMMQTNRWDGPVIPTGTSTFKPLF